MIAAGESAARRFLATESSAMTPTEARVMDIWNKVLPPRSFAMPTFELGGHPCLLFTISCSGKRRSSEIRLETFFLPLWLASQLWW